MHFIFLQKLHKTNIFLFIPILVLFFSRVIIVLFIFALVSVGCWDLWCTPTVPLFDWHCCPILCYAGCNWRVCFLTCQDKIKRSLMTRNTLPLSLMCCPLHLMQSRVELFFLQENTETMGNMLCYKRILNNWIIILLMLNLCESLHGTAALTLTLVTSLVIKTPP